MLFPSIRIWLPPGNFLNVLGFLFHKTISLKAMLFFCHFWWHEHPRNSYLYKDLDINVSSIVITYSISSNFSAMLWALQFSIFILSSFVEDFVVVSFQQKNEIKKGNTLIEFKYLLFHSGIDLFDVKDFQKKLDRW